MKPIQCIRAFAKCESGATAVEYGLIVALIAMGIIVAMESMGNSFSNFFNATSTKLEASKPS